MVLGLRRSKGLVSKLVSGEGEAGTDLACVFVGSYREPQARPFGGMTHSGLAGDVGQAITGGASKANPSWREEEKVAAAFVNADASRMFVSGQHGTDARWTRPRATVI